MGPEVRFDGRFRWLDTRNTWEGCLVLKQTDVILSLG